LDQVNTLEVNIDRLWDGILASSKIGPGIAGGMSRLALSDDDKKMRDLFVKWCTDAGCRIKVDSIGNIFAERAGTDSKLPPVLIGSHLDTQIAGGKYDGILGVLSGLEIIRTLNDRAIETKRPIHLVNWTNEEGVRFQPPMMGSGAFALVHEDNWLLEQTDDEGVALGEELCRLGYAGSDTVSHTDYDSYFELHIEQGPVLDEEGIHVGIVTGGFTSYGAHVSIEGENAHSGPPPMRKRRNALVGAARLIASVDDIGWKAEPDGRTACSRIDVAPNKYGILPHRSEVTIDVRHPNSDHAANMYQQALDLIPQVSEKSNTNIQIEKEWSFGGIDLNPDLINIIRTVSSELNVSHKHMVSVAGHDAYHLSRVMPTALIFTPCHDGITHNENEHVEPGYTGPGVNVLLHSVLRRANA